MSTADAYQRWLHSTSRSSGTIALRMRHLATLARIVDPTQATYHHIEQALFDAREHAPETRKSMLASWRVYYRWALREGLVERDPTLDVESIRVPRKMPRVAADDDVSDALEHSTTQHRAMLMLGRYGCLRLSEIARLHTRDRHGDRLLIVGKGGVERYVYAPDELLAALKALELEQGPGYYFPGRRGPHMHPQSVHKIIKRLCGWNPHSLRHAGATQAHNETKDIRAVQEMLGHASVATTQRYTHLDDDARRSVARATVIRPRRHLHLVA